MANSASITCKHSALSAARGSDTSTMRGPNFPTCSQILIIIHAHTRVSTQLTHYNTKLISTIHSYPAASHIVFFIFATGWRQWLEIMVGDNLHLSSAGWRQRLETLGWRRALYVLLLHLLVRGSVGVDGWRLHRSRTLQDNT